MEIEMFTKALKHAQDEFYLDAISELKELIVNYPDSELVDDALYDLGLCYFNLNQFEQAIIQFYLVMSNYPDATISILSSGNEYGKTSSKAMYGIINCHLAQGSIELAKNMLEKLEKDKNSYVQVNNSKITFYEMAKNLIRSFENTASKKG